MFRLILITALLSLFALTATADDHADHAASTAAPPVPMEAPPAGAKVSFGNLVDGATVQSPLTVQMVAVGMAVQPAGELKAGTGHHHIIVDGGPMNAGDFVPKDATHIHFGDGSTTATLNLTPGPHTLTLQFADGLHRAYGPAMAATVKINVTAPPPVR